jgi:hypothetical protein
MYVTIMRYVDNEPLVETDISDEAFAEYMEAAQQPQGLIGLGALLTILGDNGDLVGDDVPNNTTVFVSECL